MFGQDFIDLIFTWSLMGLYLSLAAGLAYFMARMALIGGAIFGVFWILDRVPFLN